MAALRRGRSLLAAKLSTPVRAQEIKIKKTKYRFANEIAHRTWKLERRDRITVAKRDAKEMYNDRRSSMQFHYFTIDPVGPPKKIISKMLDTEGLTRIRKMNVPELLDFARESAGTRPSTLDTALAHRALRLLSLATPEEVCEIAGAIRNRLLLKAISDRFLTNYSAEVFVARCGFSAIAELVETFAETAQSADSRVRSLVIATRGSVRETLDDLVKFQRACAALKVRADESIVESIARVLKSRLSREGRIERKHEKSNVIFKLDDSAFEEEDLPSGRVVVESVECIVAGGRLCGVDRAEILRRILEVMARLDLSLEEMSRLAMGVSEVGGCELLYEYRASLRDSIDRSSSKEITPSSAALALMAANAVGLHDRTRQRRLFNALSKSADSSRAAAALAYCHRFGSWTSSRLVSKVDPGARPIGVIGRVIDGTFYKGSVGRRLRMRHLREYRSFLPAHHLARLLLARRVRSSRETFHALLGELRNFEGDWVAAVASFMVLGELCPPIASLPSPVDRYCDTEEGPRDIRPPGNPIPVARRLAVKSECAVSKLHVRCEACQKARKSLYAAMCLRGAWCF
ncbi:hypothetical protein FOZ60_014585 [Perkinsus olseni]|uniref:Uncharacterized protein n=1 Tax=Perkinsus olseni TaxID=32597 RepID=A0A7J6N884_PEROL|nr:hypothetical protein FOZ60_014585 [Perkinsus olseni]